MLRLQWQAHVAGTLEFIDSGTLLSATIPWGGLRFCSSGPLKFALSQSEFHVTSNNTHFAFTPNEIFAIYFWKQCIGSNLLRFQWIFWKQCIGTGDAQSYSSSSFAGASGSHRLSSSTSILATSPLRSGLPVSKLSASRWPRRVSRSVNNFI